MLTMCRMENRILKPMLFDPIKRRTLQKPVLVGASIPDVQQARCQPSALLISLPLLSHDYVHAIFRSLPLLMASQRMSQSTRYSRSSRMPRYVSPMFCTYSLKFRSVPDTQIGDSDFVGFLSTENHVCIPIWFGSCRLRICTGVLRITCIYFGPLACSVYLHTPSAMYTRKDR